MTELRAPNRAMFWRILRRLFGANRGRLFVMLLALGAGAAVTAALLNLQVDAKRRLTTEFRAFGANVLITLRGDGGSRDLIGSAYDRVPRKNGSDLIAKARLLYGIANAAQWDTHSQTSSAHQAIPVVIVGYQSYGDLSDLFPAAVVAEPSQRHIALGSPDCKLGERLANQLGVHILQFVQVSTEGGSVVCYVTRISRSGGPEDSQLFLDMVSARDLLKNQKTSEVVAVNVPGDSRSIANYMSELQRSMPEVDVRPIRQFTEGEAKIYNRISGLLTATVGIVLLLTALCVMAAMTNVAMERKMDVGLMKALGGATRRVVRLFLTEAALLGLIGGAIGAAAGIFLSMGLGKAVFGVAARPRLIVYPVAVALTILVAVVSAFPLRRLASLRPASVFRGEA